MATAKYKLEQLLRDYVAEINPSLLDQLALSSALKQLDGNEGSMVKFVEWAIQRQQLEEGEDGKAKDVIVSTSNSTL